MNTATPNFNTAIHGIINDIQAIFAKGNAADIAELYTEEGMLLPAGFDFVQGRANIASFWQSAIDMGIKQLKFDLVEVEQHGDTAIEVSKYQMRSADDHVIDEGKGMVIWKCEGGVWKLHRDIWTSSLAQQ
jgi:uncharacterized protein (TIGR02246 family)